MSTTPQSSAETRAPVPTGREPARADRDSAEASAAKESLYAHASRSLRTTARAAATAVQSTARRATIPALDAGIALLQSLRKRVGADKAADDGGSGSRKDRPGGRRDDAAPEAPAPRRRLGPFLVYLGILLAGGAGGGALAYHLLEERLSHQTAENVSQAVVKSNKPVPVAATKKDPEAEQSDNADAEKQLEEAQARLEEMQAKAEEMQAKLEEAQEKLEETQTARVNAEKKLAASLAGYTKSAAEKQKKLDAAEKQLAMLSAERAGAGQRPSLASRDSAARRQPVKAGNCDLGSGNVDTLKSCLENFNR